MRENIESKASAKRLKLDEVSEQFGVRINSLRYHIKKLKPLFLDVSRDRYNRFLFTPLQIDRLLLIHRLKNQGYPYEKIKEQLMRDAEHLTEGPEQLNQESEQLTERSEQLRNSVNSKSHVDARSISADPDKRGWVHKLDQMEKHQKKLHEINKILIETNKQLDKIIAEQNSKIDSLEERVALLIDLHTENLLKRGLNLDRHMDLFFETDKEPSD